MATLLDLANLIFSDVNETVEDLENKFPKRNLPENAYVTRFAPSPTGFLHTGSLFTSMIACKMAKQSGGVFYIRLEDTDTKREIEGSGVSLLEQLKVFGINPDEGYLGDHEEGLYGPYCQSDREHLYRVVIKDLMIKGRAYPCFCSQEELNVLREKQEQEKIIPGYYGEYAKCRTLSVDEAIEKIKNGEKFVIRFKSMGDHNNKIAVHDLIRGDFELSENDQDIVILKSDGLPTYHFAHACDDHFMRTNCVTRGEEWLSSLPIHLELFDTLGFERPSYAHLPVIMKLDNGNRRKLSKRKDNEAACSFFIEDGYPAQALIEYLMTIANSNFEEWLDNNPNTDTSEFKLDFKKMSASGSLFDVSKLFNISKNYLSRQTATTIYNNLLKWALEFDQEFATILKNNQDFAIKVFNIERETPKPRKDYLSYSDIKNHVWYMFDEYFHDLIYDFQKVNTKEEITNILTTYLNNYLDLSDKDIWFNKIKEMCDTLGYASNMKDYKKNPENYKGNVADVSTVLRVALTTKTNTPDLYEIMNLLGEDKIKERFTKCLNNLD